MHIWFEAMQIKGENWDFEKFWFWVQTSNTHLAKFSNLSMRKCVRHLSVSSPYFHFLCVNNGQLASLSPDTSRYNYVPFCRIQRLYCSSLRYSNYSVMLLSVFSKILTNSHSIYVSAVCDSVLPCTELSTMYYNETKSRFLRLNKIFAGDVHV